MKTLFVESKGLRFETGSGALQIAGVCVEAACDAQTALWMLAGGRYRAVILELDGDPLAWEVIAAALWTRPPARVIGLARAPIPPELRRRAYGAGVWELLETPSPAANPSRRVTAMAAAARRAMKEPGAASVLFVDACSDITRGIGSLIEEEGYLVEPARSVGEALRMMATRDYGLIVTEISHDAPDGFQVLRDAARLQPGVPVVLFTAALDDETFLRAVELGARGFVSKLSEPDEILAEIRAVAQPGPTRGSSRA